MDILSNVQDIGDVLVDVMSLEFLWLHIQIHPQLL